MSARKDLAARVRTEREAQGLPEYVEDEAVLDRVIALLLDPPAEGRDGDDAPRGNGDGPG